MSTYDLRQLNPNERDMVLLIDNGGIQSSDSGRPLIVSFMRFIENPSHARNIAVIVLGDEHYYFEAEKALYLSYHKHLFGLITLDAFDDVSERKKIYHKTDRFYVGSEQIIGALRNEKEFRSHAQTIEAIGQAIGAI